MFTIEELMSEVWYDRYFSPTYRQGALLADYVLRQYGGPKWFELYRTCSRVTFAEDCRRVLGVSVEELDRAFWADLQRWVAESGPGSTNPINPLRAAQLADGIDGQQWRQVAERHWSAYLQARNRFRRVRFSVESQWELVGDSGQRTRRTLHWQHIEDWPRVLRVSRMEAEGEIEVEIGAADPEQSFLVSRSEGDRNGLKNRLQYSGIQRYDMVRARDLIGTADDLLAFSYRTRWLDSGMPPKNLRVTAVEPIHRDGRDLWEISYELTATGPEGIEHQNGWFRLAPDYQWAIKQEKLTRSVAAQTNSTLRSLHYEFSPHGLPILKAVHESSTGDRQSSAEHRVLDVNFGPASADEFTAEALGLPDWVANNRPTVPWSLRITSAGTFLSLVGGLVLLASRQCFSRAG